MHGRGHQLAERKQSGVQTMSQKERLDYRALAVLQRVYESGLT